MVLRIYVRTFVVKAFGWDDRCMVFAQVIHTVNVICATGGALTGTGRLMKDIPPHSMMMALRVNKVQPNVDQYAYANLCSPSVLVDMLLDVLPDHDKCQSIPRSLATALHTFHTGVVPIHHTFCHLDQRCYRRCVRPPSNVSVQTCSLLLDQSYGRQRNLYKHGCYHNFDICHVCYLRRFRFRFYYPPRVPSQRPIHESKSKVCSCSHPQYGMHVSCSSLRTATKMAC